MRQLVGSITFLLETSVVQRVRSLRLVIYKFVPVSGCCVTIPCYLQFLISTTQGIFVAYYCDSCTKKNFYILSGSLCEISMLVAYLYQSQVQQHHNGCDFIVMTCHKHLRTAKYITNAWIVQIRYTVQSSLYG